MGGGGGGGGGGIYQTGAKVYTFTGVVVSMTNARMLCIVMAIMNKLMQYLVFFSTLV